MKAAICSHRFNASERGRPGAVHAPAPAEGLEAQERRLRRPAPCFPGRALGVVAIDGGCFLTLLRHGPASQRPQPVVGLASRMEPATLGSELIAPVRSPQLVLSCRLGARLAAIHVSSVTSRADHYQRAASDAVEKSLRQHLPSLSRAPACRSAVSGGARPPASRQPRRRG
jgi:hypothetical protein